MKFTTSALSILSFAAASQACDMTQTFTSCDLAEVLVQTGCTETQFKQNVGGVEAKVFVESQCTAVRAKIRSEMLPWDKVTVRGKQFDDSFFDGGSIFNTQDHKSAMTDPAAVDPETQRLLDISGVVLKSGGIAWPDPYIKNFNLEESCQSQTAMCCWTATRNGDSVEIPTEEANTKVCAHDIGDSPKSARVEGGESIFFPADAGGRNTVCEGFYWDGISSDYKGNLLFKVAMEDGLMKHGYVRNIPSAPMCACVEQMPTVTNAGCTKIHVTETFKISYSDLEEKHFIELAQDPDISFADCGALKEAYDSVMSATTGLELVKVIGNGTLADDVKCETLSSTKLSGNGYVPKDPNMKWEPVAGRGILAYPILTPDEFRAVFAQSNTKIVRRKCLECDLTHKDIYYKRISDPDGLLPADFDLLHTLLDSWQENDHNRFNESFEIYNSYEAAVAGDTSQRWTYCNFHSGVGFPRDCGPTQYTPNQWNRFYSGSGKMVAFYVDLSE